MLKGKVALVTGASRGIGKAIAIELAANGADVILNYNGSKEKAEEVAAFIKENGGNAELLGCNVADYTACEEFIQQAIALQGKVDILVNNAGITKDGLLMKMSEEDFDKVININLKGTFNCTKFLTRQMLRQKSGRIINIASAVGVVGNAGQANYAASKAGIIGFTKSAARELASRGITVNAVAPGFIETDMTDALPEAIKEETLKQIPAKAYGKPEDVAKTVVFLASDAGRYITGQVICVDGGMTM